ncbi:hypothetical protein CCACVL1_05998, partial [Corchorus capsularis]
SFSFSRFPSPAAVNYAFSSTMRLLVVFFLSF